MPILFSIAGLISSCVQSRSSNNSFAQCYHAIEEIKRDVELTRKGKVAYIDVYEVKPEELFDGSPFPRKTAIRFSLGDQRMKPATESQLQASLKIINPSLTKEYAVKIIDNCDEVVGVTIGRSFSGNSYSYSYMGKGEIKEDTCVEHPKVRQWGERWCS